MTSSHAFLYEQCDIPAGVTLHEWRVASAGPARPRLRDRLRPAALRHGGRAR
jgi:hypothetical protein